MANIKSAKIPLVPEYSFTFSFEENFNVDQAFKWLNDNTHLPWIIGVFIYLPALYVLQKFMANREPMKLRGPLIVWNFGLAIFSLIGFLRVFPEWYHIYSNFGFQHAVCNNAYIHSKPAVFWLYAFVLSKTPELVDTLFLVFKKQKLIFLHVYHHSSVVVWAWLVFSQKVAMSRWFCSMNYGVHAIMYTYFALKAMPNLVRIPKWISMVITSMQTVQMVIGTSIVIASIKYQLSGVDCQTNFVIGTTCLFFYSSFLFLFAQFFYRSYMTPTPLKQRDDKKKA